MEHQELVKRYATKSDEELLRIRLDSTNLRQEATIALAGELAKRGLGGEDKLSAFREREEEREETESKNPGNLFLASRFGIGRWYFGKAERSFDSATRIERFQTTVFILLLWFPLIPTGTYLIRKRAGFFANKITVERKLPLDWGQILRVWGVALAGLAALIFVIKRL